MLDRISKMKFQEQKAMQKRVLDDNENITFDDQELNLSTENNNEPISQEANEDDESWDDLGLEKIEMDSQIFDDAGEERNELSESNSFGKEDIYSLRPDNTNQNDDDFTSFLADEISEFNKKPKYSAREHQMRRNKNIRQYLSQ